MPSTPILRACSVLVLLLGGTAFAAEPVHPAHPRDAKKPEQPAKPPVPPAPPPAPAVPPGPLNTPAPLIDAADRALVEAVAHAGSRLVAVGVHGLVLLSDDNGLSWRQVQPPVRATLTGVMFADENTGWAIGHYGVVLRTEDAGESWTLVLDADRAAQITLDAALAANGSDSVRAKAIANARRLAGADPSRPFLLMQGDGVDTLRTIGTDGMALETQDAGKHWHGWSNAIENPDGLPLLGLAERDGVVVVDGGRGVVLAGRPEDGLARLRTQADATLFGALDAGRYGFLLFGQQGNAVVGTLAQPVGSTKSDSWHQVDSPTQNSFTAGLLRRDGTAVLGDSAGMVWVLSGKPDDPRLEPAAQRAPFPILAMADTADGALVLAGSGGLLRIEPPAPPQAAVPQNGAQTPAQAAAPAAVPASGGAPKPAAPSDTKAAAVPPAPGAVPPGKGP